MPSTDTRPRTPSVSELQAALEAARQGVFAAGAPAAAPAAAPPESGATDTETTAPLSAPPVTPRSSGRRPQSPPRGPVPADGPNSGVWLLGVHGGSGARCLASVLTGTRSSGGAWPEPAGGRGQVVLVCRTSHRGLAAAQDHARQFRDDPALRDQLDLLGVIVSADAPGRLPPPLRRLERLVSGAVPVLGEVPWQPAWRLGPAQPFPEPPAWLTKLQQTLSVAAPR
jgi:hypothetical protein